MSLCYFVVSLRYFVVSLCYFVASPVDFVMSDALFEIIGRAEYWTILCSWTEQNFHESRGIYKMNLITAHLTAEANGKAVNNTVYRKILYREIYPSSVTEFKPPTELP